MRKFLLFLLLCLQTIFAQNIPLVVNTWNFNRAAQKAWDVLKLEDGNTDLTLDSITEGCNVCQEEQCDFTVGYGGSPDENGETTLDALIFDGDTMDMGAVGGLRRVKNVIQVARHVLENTKHSFLVGDQSTQFAAGLGFTEESLSTNYSTKLWEEWKQNNCQPNFWKNVSPDPTKSCGPYKTNFEHGNHITKDFATKSYNSKNHDTIGMIVINNAGHVVAGTSTNGANHKIPGRVGDSPIAGAGAYADNEVGAAVATGDGDVMMRFLPSFLSVELMRNGASPSKAAKIALSRIVDKYPDFFGALLVVSKKGEIGAACNGMDKFPYSLANNNHDDSIIKYVVCSNGTTF